MEDSTRHLPLWIPLLLAGIGGVLVSIQSRINGELSVRLDDGFAASVISFGSGFLILCVAMAVSPYGRRGVGLAVAAVRSGELRWWMLLGGLAGAFFVLAQGLSAPVLGVALFTVAIVAGQAGGGLVFDRLGLGPGGPRPVTANRAVGSVLALVAVFIAVAPRLGEPAALGAVIMPLIAGFGMAWQQAVNGRVRVSSTSALAATFGNFLFGTIALVVAFLIHSLATSWPSALPTGWWLYVGGAVGCVFIAASAVLVRFTGVLLLGLAMLAGQLVGAVALDLVAPLGASVSLLAEIATISGAVVAFVAVIVASASRRRPAGR